MPSKTADDSIYCIEYIIDRINDNIDIWKQYQTDIENNHFKINFNKFDTKIKAFNGDRATTNYSIKRKLEDSTELNINTESKDMFNCITHDINSYAKHTFFIFLYACMSCTLLRDIRDVCQKKKLLLCIAYSLINVSRVTIPSNF